MRSLVRIFLQVVLAYAAASGVMALPEAQAQSQGQGGQSRGGRSQPDASNLPSPSPDVPPRPLFLSGSVRLTDGSLPPESVLIERVCNGQTRPEGYTDSQGNFSFLVGGQANFILADASTQTDPLLSVLSSSNTSRQGYMSPRDLAGCEIQAKLAGFQSTTIVLTSRSAMDNPNVGVLYLSRLTNVEGLTSSVTTASAPKDAREAYEKGIDNAKKQKWTDAERDFLKAVRIYPRYAVAWYDLGRVYQQQKKVDDAVRAQNEAIKIDPKFISPYAQLTLLSAIQGKWEDVALHSSKVIKMNPDETSDIYFYSAVAHYNLKKLDVAEDHARQAAALDPQHKNPGINHLLGVILVQTRKYEEAGENLKLYLKMVPNAPEAPAINQMLDEIDKSVATPPKPRF
jgi:tetratricopeptide (TPR) repeat protein